MTIIIHNKIKLLSITLYIINKYSLPFLSTLYKEYISKSITKYQYLIVLLLCKSYSSNNIFEDKYIYKFIDNYIKNYNTNLFNKLIFT